MRRALYILGSSGLAREVQLVLDAVNAREQRWDFRGFIGERALEGKGPGGCVVAGDDEWLLAQDGAADLVIGIGRPRVRQSVAGKFLAAGGRFAFPNLIHPAATFDTGRNALGQGNIITAGCVLTCDIEIADFNYFNLQSTVGHDARIGSFNVLNPAVNVSGGVRLGDRILVGTGAQILENLSVGDDATVGAGAVVVRDVAAGSTVVGVPAKPRG